MSNLSRVIHWKWGRPYTRRGNYVEINGVGQVDTPTLEAAAKEWLAMQKPKDDARLALANTDCQMARIAEDLIDTLVAQGKLDYLMLPKEARAVIDQRKAARSKV